MNEDIKKLLEIARTNTLICMDHDKGAMDVYKSELEFFDRLEKLFTTK